MGKENILPFTIRPATIQDLQAISDLETECFTIPWSRKSLETDLQGNQYAHYLAAVRAGKVIGYIGLYLIFEDAEITNLAVTSSCRAQGVGTALVRAACSIAAQSGAVQMTLEVRESNYAARSLYRREGFHEISVRKAYYSDNRENAIIMLKKFS